LREFLPDWIRARWIWEAIAQALQSISASRVSTVVTSRSRRRSELLYSALVELNIFRSRFGGLERSAKQNEDRSLRKVHAIGRDNEVPCMRQDCLCVALERHERMLASFLL
jgi:hypothetical protein